MVAQTNIILDELLEGFASLHRDLKIAAFSEMLACDHRRDSSSFWNLAAVCAASPDEVTFIMLACHSSPNKSLH